MDPQYRYDRLEDQKQDSIRLIKLAAALTGQSTLHIELEEVHLSRQPTYIALSYTWDSPNDEGPLRVYQKDGYGVLRIRRNVNEVLRRLQRDLQPMTSLQVWIDAICINQDDQNEKSIQVSRMGRIYRQASEVVVYLGSEDEQTGLGLKAVALLATMIDERDMSDLSLEDSSNRDDGDDRSDSGHSLSLSQDESMTDVDVSSSNNSIEVQEEQTNTMHPPHGTECQVESRTQALQRGIKRKRTLENTVTPARPVKLERWSTLEDHHQDLAKASLEAQLRDSTGVEELLRDYIWGDGKLRHLEKIGAGPSAKNADAIVDAFETRIRGFPSDSSHDSHTLSSLGTPFGLQICQYLLDRGIKSEGQRNTEDEINGVSYISLLCLAMLHAVFGDVNMIDESKTVAYLDLAASDREIHKIRCDIDAPSTRSLLEIATEQLGADACEILGDLSPDSNIHTTIQAIFSIFDRPWFSRVWIQQEIVLARNARVWIGDHTVKWETLFSADLFCFQYDLRFGKGTGTCAVLEGKRVMREDDEQASPASMFISHAAYARRVSSTDPRDKVYGWLGLIPDEHAKLITPSYGISVSKTFQGLAQLLITHYRSLEILTLRFPQDSDEMPSWVPDLNGKCELDEAGIGNMRTSYPSFSATADSKVLGQVCPNDSRTLLLEGVMVDEVIATSVAFRQKESVGRVALLRKKTIELVIGAWASLALTHCPYHYATGECVSDAFWKTLIQHRGQNGIQFSREDRYAALQTVIYHLKTDLPLPPDVPRVDLESELLDEIHWRGTPETMLDYIAMQLGSLRFFVTRNGYMGVGYYNVLEGDHIVLFSGGRMPFCIRKDGLAYRLQSLCYVHGMMDGSMWQRRMAQIEDIRLI